jgi:ferredoxin--NADP+ reductase
MGRIPELLESGKLTDDLGLPRLCAETDRAMLCGSPAFLTDTVALLEKLGFDEGSRSKAGQYVIEKAFVEK